MAAKNKLQATARIVFDCSTLTGSYALAGSFTDELVVLKIYNASSNDIDVSYNGSADQDVYPANSPFVLDVQSNKEGDRAAWPAKVPFYIKGTASAGNLYIIGYKLE